MIETLKTKFLLNYRGIFTQKSLWLMFLILILSLCPLTLAYAVWRAPNMMNLDYWYVLTSIFNPDGSIRWHGIFELGNEHPLIIPKLIFIGSALYGGGNATFLGAFCWLIAALQCIVLYQMSPHKHSSDRMTQHICLLLIIAFSFSPHAVHNFVRGVSGPLWIPANFAVVLTLFMAVRGQLITTALMGVIASMTFGPALAVWPALIAVLWYQKKSPNVLAIFLFLAATVIGIYSMVYVTPIHHPKPSLALIGILRILVTVVGNPLADKPDMAVTIGALALPFGIFALFRAINERRVSIFWGGVAIYTLTTFLMIGITRESLYEADASGAMASRYASLPSLFWLSVSMAIISLAAHISYARTGLMALVLLMCTSAVPYLRSYEEENHYFNLSAIATKLGLAPLDSFNVPHLTPTVRDSIVPILQSLDNYPFNHSFKFDCGLINSSVPLSAIIVDPNVVKGSLDMMRPDPQLSIVRIEGWAFSSGEEIKCIVASTQEGKIIGAGIYGLPRPDVNIALRQAGGKYGWTGIALKAEETESLLILAILENGSGTYLVNTQQK